MKYVGNPKHKHPWQAGRKGSLCSRSLPQTKAQELLDQSDEEEGHRYATHGGIAYKAVKGSDDTYHGYPVGFREVPQRIRDRWKRDDKITKREIQKNW